MMGTHWEKWKNQKIPIFPLWKREKIGSFVRVHAEPSHWLHETFISKSVHEHNWG
jgi:hypothetical protein